jgi:hypothetical protein
VLSIMISVIQSAVSGLAPFWMRRSGPGKVINFHAKRNRSR